jgi:endonuclease G
MDHSEKIARLRTMLRQVAPEHRLEAIAEKYAKRDDGLEAGELPEEVDARVGLEKLVNHDDDLTPEEAAGLEAIVMPDLRPVAFLRRDGFDELPFPWVHLNEDPYRQRILSLSPSIGRIELPDCSWCPYAGTGFVVGLDLLMTNRHVAGHFAVGLGRREIRYTPGDAAVNFHRYRRLRDDPPEPAEETAVLQVRDVVMIHPYWDMALLRVDGLTDAQVPLELSVSDPEDLFGMEVAVIGYPARDDRSDLELQDRIFERVYRVKRLQPGQVHVRGRVHSYGREVQALTHNASTLGGNSGSAIIDLETGKVVGLHFAGVYLKANYSVPAYELARDGRVVEAGVRFDGSLPPTADWGPYWRGAESAERDAAATKDFDAPTQVSADAPSVAIAGGPATVTLTIPVTITVSLGEPLTAAAGPATVPDEEALRAPFIHDGLETRAGYDPEFLGLDDGLTVPLPRLTPDGERVVATLEDGSHELKYHKFSVVVHKRRRLALFTAANVDWRPQSRLVGGVKFGRKELTGLADNDRERWVTDPRIPGAHQLPDVFYTKGGGAFDKGHLVRRDDVCWGTSKEDIQMANGDTFHTTNCSPQVAGFNRANRGEDNWGRLENMVRAETRAERAILFSGPAFADDDPLFNSRDVHGRVSIPIPRAYWKIVVVKGAGGPEAYGFILEQDLSAVPTAEEFVVPSAWRRYLRSIAEIEGLLGGLATLDWLKPHDRSGLKRGRRIDGGGASR